MDEDEEDFYDSLDEDFNSESTIQNSSKTKISDQTSVTKLHPRKDDRQGCTKIPLYIGETCKHKLKSDQKTSPKVVPINKLSTSCISCSNSCLNKSKSKIASVVRPKEKQATYWEIFCKKNGIELNKNQKEVEDTARATIGNSINTCSSFRTCYNLDGGPVCDTPSLYDDCMSKIYSRSDFYNFYEDTAPSVTMTDLSSSGNLDNLRSVSYTAIKNKISKTPCKTTSIKSNYAMLKTPAMGTLGPDLEVTKIKMERLRKQQEYGKRASNKNRARIIQRINQEINEKQLTR